jgi:peptidase E
MHTRLALIGGEEFSPGFEAVHAELLTGLGDGNRRVVYLPTAAADDGPETVEHWCTLAHEKLSALGAVVEAPRVVDAASANDERHAQMVAEADWVYLGGGYAHVAQRILQNTRVLAALVAAKARGALITGASAGAMWMGAQSIVITPDLGHLAGRAPRLGPAGAAAHRGPGLDATLGVCAAFRPPVVFTSLAPARLAPERVQPDWH